MALSNQTTMADSTLNSPLHQIAVSWSRLVHPRHDAFGPSSAIGGTSESAQHSVEFVISLQLFAEDHMILEAWLELPLGRRTIFPRQPLTCRATLGGAMLHVDCFHDERRLITASIHEDGRIAYARSDLLAEAGFTGGAYDPPTVNQISTSRDVASA
jgi:hypothetical protein